MHPCKGELFMSLKDVVLQFGVKNIICYLRRSRQDLQREKLTGEDTLKAQDDLMTETLDKITLPYDKESEIVSGESISARKVFQRIISYLEEDKYDAIAVKELTRLTRGSGTDADRIINILKDHRLIIITPFKVYDPKNPTDMKMIRFELFMSHEEYETTKERMVNARYLYAAQGKWEAGSPPFGYNYDRRKRTLYPNENESKTVKLIFDCYLKGINNTESGFLAIANHLTNLGIPTPKGNKIWRSSTINYMLKNPLYCGEINFRKRERLTNGKIVFRPKDEHIIKKNAHEKIIDSEVWIQTQEKLIRQSRRPHTKKGFKTSELASLCVCNICSAKMIRRVENRTYKKKNGEISSYHKEFLRCQKCGKLNVKYRLVEDNILIFLNELLKLDQESIREWLIKNIQENNKIKEETTYKNMMKNLNKKEQDLKSRLDFIFDKYEKQIYDDISFLKRRGKINDELEEIQKAKNEIIDSVDDKQLKQIEIEPILSAVKSMLIIYKRSKDSSKKNELLRSIIDHVVIKKISEGSGRTPSNIEIIPYLNQTLVK
jgi:DNA invertase Pin-like site-specific DNA recombinase